MRWWEKTEENKRSFFDKLPDSEVEGWDLGRGGVDSRGGASAEKGEGEEGRAIDLIS